MLTWTALAAGGGGGVVWGQGVVAGQVTLGLGYRQHPGLALEGGTTVGPSRPVWVLLALVHTPYGRRRQQHTPRLYCTIMTNNKEVLYSCLGVLNYGVWWAKGINFCAPSMVLFTLCAVTLKSRVHAHSS